MVDVGGSSASGSSSVGSLSRLDRLQALPSSSASSQSSSAHRSTTLQFSSASTAVVDPTEKRGWCLKKGKSDKPWTKSHHSHRYFVSRSHALCYFERAGSADSELGGSRLLGIIDLREVVRVRPSADPTAPANALDVVLRSRTYVLVPQPNTSEEVSSWIRAWALVLRPGGVAPELRHEAGLPDEPPRRDSVAGYSSVAGSGMMRGSMLGSMVGSFVGRRSFVVDENSGEGEDGGGTSGAAADDGQYSLPPAPEVLLQGFLLKMPVKSEHRKQPSLSGFASLLQLGELTSWRRRYFQLRPGLLQWYRDDPGVGGEFLGVLRLTADTSVEPDTKEARLKVTAAGETLVLRDDAGEQLGTWEAELREQVQRVRESAKRGDARYADGGTGSVDLD